MENNSIREFTCNDCQEVTKVDWSKVRPDIDDGTSNIEIHEKGNGYAYYGECTNCGNLVEIEPPVPELIVDNVDVNKYGIDIQLTDTVTNRSCWIDAWKDKNGEWEYDFNQYIFHLDNDNDIIAKMFQEDLGSYAEDVFDCVMGAIDEHEDVYNKLQENKAPTMRDRLKEAQSNKFERATRTKTESKNIETENRKTTEVDNAGLYLYTDANSYDKEEAERNILIYEQEAPELKFEIFKDKNDMYFVKFIGTKKDLVNYLTKLGWYTEDEIEEYDLIVPYSEKVNKVESKKVKTESKRKAINIQWDTDGEDVDLPTEIEIPDDIDDEDIGDYISDETGFCHFGFDMAQDVKTEADDEGYYVGYADKHKEIWLELMKLWVKEKDDKGNIKYVLDCIGPKIEIIKTGKDRYYSLYIDDKYCIEDVIPTLKRSGIYFYFGNATKQEVEETFKQHNLTIVADKKVEEYSLDKDNFKRVKIESKLVSNTIKDYAMHYLDGEIDNDVCDTEIDMLVCFSYDFNETPEDSYSEFINILGERTKVVKVNGEILVCDFSSVFKPYNEQLKKFFDMDNSEFDEDEAYYEAVVNLEALISGNASESDYKELNDILKNRKKEKHLEMSNEKGYEENKLADDIEKYLTDNQIYPADVSVSDTRVMVELHWGDWKHDHLRCDDLMEAKGYSLEEEEVTEEDGSDCYSAIRYYASNGKYDNVEESKKTESKYMTRFAQKEYDGFYTYPEWDASTEESAYDIAKSKSVDEYPAVVIIDGTMYDKDKNVIHSYIQKCPMCKNEYAIDNVDVNLIKDYLHSADKKVQDVFPELNQVEREFIKSGYCPECQKDLFGTDITSNKINRISALGNIITESKALKTEAMNGFNSENSVAQQLYDDFVEFEDIDEDKWNKSTAEERIRMVRPQVVKFYKQNRAKIDDNWDDFMELLEYWNYHTEYKIFNDLAYDEILNVDESKKVTESREEDALKNRTSNINK